jgi:broad specificity phosphatase PhoE
VSASEPEAASRGGSDTVIASVRHGLTQLNRDKLVGGRLDAPLIDEGRDQAREAGATLDGTSFDVIVSSPLGRALETAQIVTGRTREEIVVMDECTERSFGLMEGISPADVPARFPEVNYLEKGHVRYSLNPPGGESFEQLHARAERFFARLLREFAGARIVVFSHQNFLQQFHGAIRRLGPYESLEYDILNCELNEFRLRDRHLLGSRTVQLCSTAAHHPSF